MNRNFKDMTGLRFGRLVVLQRGENIHGAVGWLCVCDCGNDLSVYGPSLRKGATKSCGCLSKDTTGANFRTHGLSKTREYRSWLKMKERCYSETHHQFADYGGRGIAVCDWWLDSFEHFLADVGPRPSHAHTIDRIENDRDYEPGNCRWATRKEQNRNTRAVKPVRRSDGVEYACVGAAIEQVGGSESSMRSACRSGREHLGHRWAFVDRGATARSEAA